LVTFWLQNNDNIAGLNTTVPPADIFKVKTQASQIKLLNTAPRLKRCNLGSILAVSRIRVPAVWAERAAESPATDDKELLERLRQGDEEAARALVQRLYPLVVRLVRHRQARTVGEDDLVQMVFMKVFAKLEQYSGAVPLDHWVSRIAVNTCYSQLAYERVRPERRWADMTEEEEAVVRDLGATDAEPSAAQGLIARELVEKLMALLKPEEQLILRWLHLESLSVAEIRQRTGWSISRIKVRAFRARQKLKQHLKKLLSESDHESA
jgi:RNA polymerase sigma-70 factor (ECF subfamily)